jgi:hypothetical protein
MEENDLDTLNLWRVPEEASASGLLVRVILRPTKDCDTLDDFLYNTFRKEIADGAMSSLFGMRARPWYDLRESEKLRAFFNSGIANAKIKKATGATKRPMRVQYRARGMIGL